jgi:hypothetical protein
MEKFGGNIKFMIWSGSLIPRTSSPFWLAFRLLGFRFLWPRCICNHARFCLRSTCLCKETLKLFSKNRKLSDSAFFVHGKSGENEIWFQLGLGVKCSRNEISQFSNESLCTFTFISQVLSLPNSVTRFGEFAPFGGNKFHTLYGIMFYTFLSSLGYFCYSLFGVSYFPRAK